MSKQSLRENLQKAEYLLVILKKSSQKRAIPTPLVNVKKVARPSQLPLAILKSTAIHRVNHLRVKRLLSSVESMRISLVKENTPKAQRALKAVHLTTSVGNNQNIHLLHYTMAYHANHQRDKAVKWQKVQPYNTFNRLKNHLSPHSDLPLRTLAKKFSKIRSQKGDLLNESRESLDSIALEKEMSHRRNYRTSRPLHT